MDNQALESYRASSTELLIKCHIASKLWKSRAPETCCYNLVFPRRILSYLQSTEACLLQGFSLLQEGDSKWCRSLPRLTLWPSDCQMKALVITCSLKTWSNVSSHIERCYFFLLGGEVFNNNNNNNSNFKKCILVLTVKFDSLAIFFFFFFLKKRKRSTTKKPFENNSFSCILREVYQIHCKIYLLKSASLHLLTTTSNSN